MSTPTPWGSPSAGGPQQGGPQRPRRRSAAGWIRPFIVIAALAGVLIWLFAVDHETHYSAVPTDTSTAVTDTSTDSTDTTDTSTGSDGAIVTGDCLSVDGPQPTATETVDVSNITQVDCSSSSAQYKVVGVEPFTTDMNSCATDYPQSTASLLDQGQYFSAVYCVVDATS